MALIMEILEIYQEEQLLTEYCVIKPLYKLKYDEYHRVFPSMTY